MNMTLLNDAATRVRALLPAARPTAGLVLGSGWNDVVQAFTLLRSIPYADVPGLGATGVEGHAGQLHWARCGALELLVFQGRRHWYEGAGWDPVALPVWVTRQLGAGVLILTNSAGGIRRTWRPGHLMLIDDHLNLMGANPLIGPATPDWGPRFPDLSCVYDRRLCRALVKSANRLGLHLKRGLYAAVSGPAYETPAEVSALRRMGADAVGMSTVPEAILAHAAGLRVVGLSCIANAAAARGRRLAHADVLTGAAGAAPRLTRLLTAFLGDLHATSAE